MLFIGLIQSQEKCYIVILFLLLLLTCNTRLHRIIPVPTWVIPWLRALSGISNTPGTTCRLTLATSLGSINVTFFSLLGCKINECQFTLAEKFAFEYTRRILTSIVSCHTQFYDCRLYDKNWLFWLTFLWY